MATTSRLITAAAVVTLSTSTAQAWPLPLLRNVPQEPQQPFGTPPALPGPPTLGPQPRPAPELPMPQPPVFRPPPSTTSCIDTGNGVLVCNTF